MISEIGCKERGTNNISTNEYNELGQCVLREGAGDADGGRSDKGKWELL